MVDLPLLLYFFLYIYIHSRLFAICFYIYTFVYTYINIYIYIYDRWLGRWPGWRPKSRMLGPEPWLIGVAWGPHEHPSPFRDPQQSRVPRPPFWPPLTASSPTAPRVHQWQDPIHICGEYIFANLPTALWYIQAVLHTYEWPLLQRLQEGIV